MTYVTDQDLITLENGLYKLIDMQKEEKQRKEDAKRMREEEKMRKYGRTKPMSFNEIHAKLKAEQQWLEAKRSSAYTDTMQHTHY
jgi:hypothetical protein